MLVIENSEPVVWIAGVLALISLIALKVTGRGKFLLWAGLAAALAAAAFVIDLVWVTDIERIEGVVYAMAKAAKNADADSLLAHVTDDLRLEQGGSDLGPLANLARGAPAREMIRTAIRSTQFNTIAVREMHVDAGAQSRQGKADFRVFMTGTYNGATFGDNENTDWSFGFREAAPGVWKVTRITAVRLPNGASLGGNAGAAAP